jgi:opacity protein-like surface antigen
VERFILLLFAIPAAAQPIGVQFKVGIPITGFNAYDYPFRTVLQTFSNRYVIGPAVEVHLPSRFAVELDATYQRVHLNGSSVSGGGTDNLNASGHAWDFPILAKYRFLHRPITPFVVAGPAIRWLEFSGSEMRRTNIGTSVMALADSNVGVGWAVGGGLELKVKSIRISPELRYTSFGNFTCSQCLGLTLSGASFTAFPPLNSTAVMLGVGF